MSRLTIDTGTAGNAATGDSLRVAFEKVNANFSEVYASQGIDLENIPSSLIPATNGIYDIGSPSKQWRSMYVSLNTLYINNVPISVNEGSNTIVVGNNEEQTNLATESYVDAAIAALEASGVSTGNFTFAANTLSLQDNELLTIQGPGSAGANILSQSGGYSQLEWAGAHGTGVYLWIDSDGLTVENINEQRITFSNSGRTALPGTLDVGGGTATVDNIETHEDGDFTITASDKEWTFGANGNTTLPTGTLYTDNIDSSGSSNLNIVDVGSTLDVTGAATLSSTLDVTGDTVLGNTTVNGIFTLNGETQYVAAENTVYTDALLEIHAPEGGVGGAWSTNDGKDIGLRFHYYNGSDKNAGLFLDNGTWRLKYVVNGAESSGQFTNTGLGDIEANNFYGTFKGNADTATSATSADTATNANNINISTTTGNSSDTTMYPVLVATNTTGNLAPHTDISGLSYNASTNALTASTFVGALSGNATSATSATTATNLAGGAANRIAYQTGSGATSFITAPSTSDRYLRWTGSAFEWAAVTNNAFTSITVNDISSADSSAIHINDTVNISGGLTVAGTANLNGVTNIQQLHLPYTAKTNATGTVVHDCSVGEVFYHTSISGNFTPNFTNLGLNSNYITEVKLFLLQGNSARSVTAIQIAGSSKTINWYNAINPTYSTNALDIVTFTILLTGTTYTVFGKMEKYDSVAAGGGGGGD
jgi:hypothetical protein